MIKLFNRIFWHNNTTPAINEDNLNAMSKAIDDIDDRVINLAGTIMETVPEIQEMLSEAEQLEQYAQAAAQDAQDAADSATSAGNDALKSEGFAVGQQNGSDVGATSPYYRNNSKYYAGQAEIQANEATQMYVDTAAIETRLQPQINSVEAAVTTLQNNAQAIANAAANAQAAAGSALDAEAYGTGTRDGDPVTSSDPAYHNNAKYWSDLAAQYAQSFNGAVFQGSIYFANLPTSGMNNGDWYDIKDAFTTTSDFEEGAGIACAAGTDVIWVANDNKWNILTPSGVYSFNGRSGAVSPAANDYDASQIQFGSNSNVNTELGNKLPTYTADSTAYDTTPTANSTKPVISGGIKNFVDNKHKVTRFEVTSTGWSSDTTSQSGTTLYKKSISLSHVYVDVPSVDIGATGTLPTAAQQTDYDLLKYATIDGTTLYLYASAAPSAAFYINVEGVD